MTQGHRIRRNLERIFRAAVAAVDPAWLVRSHLVRDGKDLFASDGEGNFARLALPLLVVGAGKAAAAMAEGVEIAVDLDLEGLIVTAEGCGRPLRRIAIRETAHPVPDRRCLEAAREMHRRVAAQHGGTILFLLSGGASSLLVSPRPPLSLADKIAVNQMLLHSGADIHELNTVRKHLSLVKGGGLLRAAGNLAVVSLILSDVPNDDVGTIGSGPTAPDPTTFADARSILERYNLLAQVPESVRLLLDRGVAGDEPETVKEIDSDRVKNFIIGSNRTALDAAAATAADLGYQPLRRIHPLTGDTRESAEHWFEEVRDAVLASEEPRVCILAGGETTVRVTGSGRGGRNQEFALRLIEQLTGMNISILSAGTDGIDGPTDAAGAFVDPSTRERAGALGLDPHRSLLDNDSYGFFERLGDLFVSGPTGTNVMDIKIALAERPPETSE